MRAAVLERLGVPLAVSEVEVSPPVGAQVLVRIRASGICGKQLHEIAGDCGSDRFLPHLLGHEGAGQVIAVGPDVRLVAPGDHVVLHWRKGAGGEGPFPVYHRGAERVGGGAVTTFNEYALVAENRLTAIDKDVPFDVAALMGCAVTTGLGVVFTDARLKAGQTIAVLGAGGVGLNVIQGARISGVESIVAIDLNEEQLARAEAFGATEAWDDPQHMAGADVIVDTTGDVGLIAVAYDLVAPGGLVIMVGQPPRGVDLVLRDAARNFKGKRLMDSEGGGTEPNTDIPRYLGFWRRGMLKLSELITHRFPLDDVNVALDAARSGRAGRVILEM
jgi:S-(hydroxymethyl)glutathione dehydrogenase/alcohol dehydrogenase